MYGPSCPRSGNTSGSTVIGGIGEGVFTGSRSSSQLNIKNDKRISFREEILLRFNKLI
jgi:hypothetical protein